MNKKSDMIATGHRSLWIRLGRSFCAVVLLIAAGWLAQGEISFCLGAGRAAAAETPQKTSGPSETPAGVVASPNRETIKLRAMAVSESQIALAWTIASGAEGYRVYRDGSPLAATGRISEYDAKLKADTRYCYRIVALDSRGIEVSQSNEACATTAPDEAQERKAP